ncbi:MAG: hypothetical protein IJS50_00395 [Desulfovibrio sp.]|nr:hypothetical protein [Desulfovibrio sp.]
MAESITLESFLENWQIDPLKTKKALVAYYDLLRGPSVSFEFKARPGISYSLRARHAAQVKPRELFVLIDVIDDEPNERWLSVCFYADLVTDPKDLADFVPKGLLGEDALCFNLDADDQNLRNYVAERLSEALLKVQGK